MDSQLQVEYVRRLYDDVLGWYQSADTKAQVVLSIDGAFLAFLTSGLFAKPEDLEKIVGAFLPQTSSLCRCRLRSNRLSRRFPPA